MSRTRSTTAKTALLRLAIVAAVLVLTAGMAKLVDIGMPGDRTGFDMMFVVFSLLSLIAGLCLCAEAKDRSPGLFIGGVLLVGPVVFYFVYLAVGVFHAPDSRLEEKVGILFLLGMIVGLASLAAAFALTGAKDDPAGD